MNPINNDFIKGRGNSHDLIAVKKAECVYALTYHFAHRFLGRGDRTVDQMVQAARSGKQNIIEGASAATASRETEIKLYNVAKASLDELLADYTDYLLVHGFSRWNRDKIEKVRSYCKTHNEARDYLEAAPSRDAETICNLVIILIYQAQYLIQGLMEHSKNAFLHEGGIREEMSRARRARRGY